MGGIVAARYAQRWGDELAALVLSAPVIGGNPAFEQLLGMDPIPDVPIDPAVLSRDPAVGEAYAADELVYHGPFARATLESLIGAMSRIAEGPGLGDLPTLWIHGTEDALGAGARCRRSRPLGVTVGRSYEPTAVFVLRNMPTITTTIGDPASPMRERVDALDWGELRELPATSSSPSRS